MAMNRAERGVLFVISGVGLLALVFFAISLGLQCIDSSAEQVCTFSHKDIDDYPNTSLAIVSVSDCYGEYDHIINFSFDFAWSTKGITGGRVDAYNQVSASNYSAGYRVLLDQLYCANWNYVPLPFTYHRGPMRYVEKAKCRECVNYGNNYTCNPWGNCSGEMQEYLIKNSPLEKCTTDPYSTPKHLSWPCYPTQMVQGMFTGPVGGDTFYVVPYVKHRPDFSALENASMMNGAYASALESAFPQGTWAIANVAGVLELSRPLLRCNHSTWGSLCADDFEIKALFRRGSPSIGDVAHPEEVEWAGEPGVKIQTELQQVTETCTVQMTWINMCAQIASYASIVSACVACLLLTVAQVQRCVVYGESRHTCRNLAERVAKLNVNEDEHSDSEYSVPGVR